MKRVIFLSFVCTKLLFGSVTVSEEWQKGETFLGFLEKNSLPQSIYYNLDKEDQELTEEINSGVEFFVLKDEESGAIEQVLIPISEEMQIHLSKTQAGYDFRITPISYLDSEQSITLEIQKSIFEDIYDVTGDITLANELILAYKNSINFKRELRKNDRVVILFNQKIRMGKRFGSPQIKAAIIETAKKPNYLFLNADGRYYDQFGKEIEGFLLKAPVRYTRISSPFSLKRWHPVLKKYRPHYGVDYAASYGTPIRAAGSGVVRFAGYKNGYGKTIKIDHGNGFQTLYAHMSKFNKIAKNGKRVKQGDIIGYVGSTGTSTGAHLHFGVYKNNRAQNPLKNVRIDTNILKGERKKEFLALVEGYKDQLQRTIASNALPSKLQNFEHLVKLDSK